MNPAQAIQTAIGGTQASVAARVGESPQAWGQYVAGKRTPKADKVAAWCVCAGVGLWCDAHGWKAVLCAV